MPNQLIQGLAGLSIKPRRQRKRRPMVQRIVVPGAMAVANTQPGSQRKRKRRKARKGGPGTAGMADGEIRLSRLELVGDVPVQGGKWLLSPGSFTWLSTVSKPFERFCFESLALEYRPLVGTTSAGAVTYGVAWEKEPSSPLTRAKIAALTPVQDHPVWQSSRMPLAPKLLRSRPWFQVAQTESLDSYPGVVHANYNARPAAPQGELWVRYTIRLQGGFSRLTSRVREEVMQYSSLHVSEFHAPKKMWTGSMTRIVNARSPASLVSNEDFAINSGVYTLTDYQEQEVEDVNGSATITGKLIELPPGTPVPVGWFAGSAFEIHMDYQSQTQLSQGDYLEFSWSLVAAADTECLLISGVAPPQDWRAEFDFGPDLVEVSSPFQDYFALDSNQDGVARVLQIAAKGAVRAIKDLFPRIRCIFRLAMSSASWTDKSNKALSFSAACRIIRRTITPIVDLEAQHGRLATNSECSEFEVLPDAGEGPV